MDIDNYLHIKTKASNEYEVISWVSLLSTESVLSS